MIIFNVYAVRCCNVKTDDVDGVKLMSLGQYHPGFIQPVNVYKTYFAGAAVVGANSLTTGYSLQS